MSGVEEVGEIGYWNSSGGRPGIPVRLFRAALSYGEAWRIKRAGI